MLLMMPNLDHSLNLQCWSLLHRVCCSGSCFSLHNSWKESQSNIQNSFQLRAYKCYLHHTLCRLLCWAVIGHPMTFEACDWPPGMTGANLSIRHRESNGRAWPGILRSGDNTHHEDQISQSEDGVRLNWPMRGRNIIQQSGDNAKHRRPGPCRIKTK